MELILTAIVIIIWMLFVAMLDFWYAYSGIMVTIFECVWLVCWAISNGNTTRILVFFLPALHMLATCAWIYHLKHEKKNCSHVTYLMSLSISVLALTIFTYGTVEVAKELYMLTQA